MPSAFERIRILGLNLRGEARSTIRAGRFAGGRLPALQAGVGIEKDNSKGKSVEREILYFGNKSPERSSLLGSGANWSRLAPQGDVTWLKRALRIVDRD